MRILSLSLGMMAALLGCSSWENQYAREYCDLVYRCCSAAELTTRPRVGPNYDTCVASFDTTEAHKGDKLDSFKAAACLDALRSMSCESMKRGDPSIKVFCSGVHPGDRENGDYCTQSYQCKSGRCELPTDVHVKGGRCVPGRSIAATGESCAENLCKDSFCDSTDKICHPFKPDGAACQYLEECLSRDCQGALTTPPGICAPRAAGDTSCFL